MGAPAQQLVVYKKEPLALPLLLMGPPGKNISLILQQVKQFREQILAHL